MKLTKSKLQQIIKEELGRVLGDEGFDAAAAVETLENNVGMTIANEEVRNNLLNAATKEDFEELVRGLYTQEKDY